MSAVHDTTGEFSVLYARLSDTVFTESLGPAIERALRRSSARSLPVVVDVLNRCNSDMSGSANELVTLLLESVKSVELLSSAASCIGLIFRKSNSSASKIGIIKGMSASFPRFGQQSVDIAAAKVLSGLCEEESLGGQHARSERSQVCTLDVQVQKSVVESPFVQGLIRQVKQSTNEDTRIEIVTSIGNLIKWLILVSGSSMDQSIKAFIETTIKETYNSILMDKKTSSDKVKDSVVVSMENLCVNGGVVSLAHSILPCIDNYLSYMTLLIQNRQSTRRLVSLASWSVVLHLLVHGRSIVPADVVKKIKTNAFVPAVATDNVFGLDIVSDEDFKTTISKRAVLKRVFELALRCSDFPMFSANEQETIVLSTTIQKLTNRFCVNLLENIAMNNWTNFELNVQISTIFANRLVHALYEIVVSNIGSKHCSYRLAVERIVFSKFCTVDPEWAALLVVLCHHSTAFSSHHMSASSWWRKRIAKHFSVHSMFKPLSGWVMQGGRILDQLNPFRAACIDAGEWMVSAMGDDGESSVEFVTSIAQSVRSLGNTMLSAYSEEDVKIFFCPPNVVWRTEAENDWVPGGSNTVVASASSVSVTSKSAIVTRETMNRSIVKEQSSLRNKMKLVVNNINFNMDLFNRIIGVSNTVTHNIAYIEKFLTELDDPKLFLPLIRSPLTAHSAARLVDNLGYIFWRTSSLSSLIEFPENVHVWQNFWSFMTSDIMITSVSEISLLLPLIEMAFSGTALPPFNPAVAELVLNFLSNQENASPEGAIPVYPLALTVPHIHTLSQKCASVFAIAIARYLSRACVVRKSLTVSEVEQICGIATATSEERMFVEIVSKVVPDLVKLHTNTSLPPACLQALMVMARFNEGTKDLVNASTLEGGNDQQDDTLLAKEFIRLLTELPSRNSLLIQKMAAQALAVSENQNCFYLLCEMYDVEVRKQSRLVALEVLRGLALAISQLARLLTLENDLRFLLTFVLGAGLLESPSAEFVNETFMEGLTEALESVQPSFAENLITVAESFIGRGGTSQTAMAVPVVLGVLSKHLPSECVEKANSVRSKLISELLTATSSVQKKIAIVLPPLLKASNDVPKYLETFLSSALSSADASVRTGAAFGVGAATKAAGVTVLRQLEVLKRLQEAAEDKTSVVKKQGAIAVYGGLSLSLGRLFEPYVPQILPVLLMALGDPQSAHVREAATTAAEQIMQTLSPHGIKLVLPSLLNGVVNDSAEWRTKLGSIKLLNAMVHCSPKTLASCLPKIVPALAEIVTDTHSKVREAGVVALKEIGLIISNPEIRNCADKLIHSLVDPSNDAVRNVALDTLLSTSFVHSIDSASLALVIPVVLRATNERGSDTKKKGTQILGSVAVLSADANEGLAPYMPRIIPALKSVLVDPSPDVRSTAAKALGTITRALPECVLAEVLPWLFSTLKTADNQVERSGAAQGLSEVIVELGPDQFKQILPEIVANAVNLATNSEAREGYMGLFVYLPSAMKTGFIPYIETVLPMLVDGLSDPVPSVREVAQRAASAVAVQFAQTHATLLLASLEKGIFANDWQSRQYSVQLTGQVLEQLMKAAAVNVSSNANLLDSTSVPLSQERRSYLLAMLYIVRSDPNQAVNQCAQQVWKNVVSNTPRTLRLILPILVRLLIVNLRSTSSENMSSQRQILAGRCLGDLVAKIGDRVLPDIMPILTESLATSTDPMTRAGVCMGIAEIVNASNRQLLQEYFSILFPAVRRALSDESGIVRLQAGAVIQTLHKTIGTTAINNIIPSLLQELTNSSSVDDPESPATVVNAMAELVRALPKEIAPILMDALATEPVTERKLIGMESLASAPPGELTKHTSRIVSVLIHAIGTVPANPVIHCANTVFAQFNKQSSHLTILELVRGLSDKSTGTLRESCALLLECAIRTSTSDVLSDYVESLIQLLVQSLLSDSYQPAMEACLQAFGELTNKLTKEALAKHMVLISNAVKDACDDPSPPGLALPTTFAVLWPIYQHALMFGNSETRDAASAGLVDLLKATPVDRLKPNAIKVTGPIIRALGEKYAPSVKVSLLLCLQVLIDRLGVALKPFVPQLQTTYSKCTQDGDSEVKKIAEQSLSLLASRMATSSQ